MKFRNKILQVGTGTLLLAAVVLGFQNCGSFSAARLSASAGLSSSRSNATTSLPLASILSGQDGYDIIIVAGQSNAVGYGCGPYTDVPNSQDNRIFQVDPSGNVIQATDPLFFNPSHGNKTGFAMTFARLYAASLPLPRKVIVVPVAMGSTSILQWDPMIEDIPFSGGDSTALWDAMIARTTAALSYQGKPNQVVALLWHQGENDYSTIKAQTQPWLGLHPWMTNNTVYESRLHGFIETFRSAFANRGNVPVLVGEIGNFWSALSDPDPGGVMLAQFNQTIAGVAATESNTALVPAADLPNNSVMCSGATSVDVYHFSAASQIQLGQRYYAKFQSLQATGSPSLSLANMALPVAPYAVGNIQALAPITCADLNPDAIKSLSTDTITWLASLQPSGITLHENYLLAREQGYEGALGNGQHNTWLSLEANRLTSFNTAVQAMASAPAAPYANWAAHHAARRAAGYQGLFLCGGDTCFAQNQCDNLGRRLNASQEPPITYEAIQANVAISCDYFNPDAIKSLTTETIQWLASLQPSGITLHENYYLARQQGYTGAFGAGQHNAWLAQDPSRQAAFSNAVNAMANGAAPPWATWAAHNAARRAAGYQGLFLCGGDACFQQGQCDSLGRRY